MVGGPEPDYRERDARSVRAGREREVDEHLASVKAAFDDVAPVYDEVADGNRVAKVEDEFIAADLRPRLDWHGLIIDLGCGTGYLLDILPDIDPLRYVGVDISEGMINEARRKHPRYKFIRGDMHREWFIQPAAVVILGFDVLNLSPTPEALLAGIEHRMILPGGTVYAIVTTPEHARATCACHSYTPREVRSFYTEAEALRLFTPHFHAVESHPLVGPPEHANSYVIVTGRGRHYRDVNDEKPWNGPGG